MKTSNFMHSSVLGLAATLLLVGLTPEANSQPKKDSTLDLARRVQQKQALVVEQQAKTMARIEEIQKKANQARIFAKRG